MSAFDYNLEALPRKTLGLVVLQSDETIEQDYVTRVPSGLEVSQDSLQAMAHDLPAAAGLLPRGLPAARCVARGGHRHAGLRFF